MTDRSAETRLALMPGQMVAVRSAAEIEATLDEDGCLDGLPFMPEMLSYCGKTYRVFRRADKTCDTVNQTGGRRMFDTVHLADLRCDGSDHGGCEAHCLLFWKEAWLEKATSSVQSATAAQADTAIADKLSQMAKVDEETYRCQATQLPEFTTLLHWWDPRQYVRDLRTGNTNVRGMIRVSVLATFRALMRIGIGTRVLLFVYNKFQSMTGGRPFPVIEGALDKTPVEELGLQPGELVRVKPLEEINATLDSRARNRGMSFDPEMARYCGGIYRVLRRVERILDEKSGRMLTFRTPGIMLDNVFCMSEMSSGRLFCPRRIPSYWREIWLERVEGDPPRSEDQPLK